MGVEILSVPKGDCNSISPDLSVPTTVAVKGVCVLTCVAEGVGVVAAPVGRVWVEVALLAVRFAVPVEGAAAGGVVLLAVGDEGGVAADGVCVGVGCAIVDVVGALGVLVGFCCAAGLLGLCEVCAMGVFPPIF